MVDTFKPTKARAGKQKSLQGVAQGGVRPKSDSEQGSPTARVTLGPFGAPRTRCEASDRVQALVHLAGDLFNQPVEDLERLKEG